LIWLGGGVAGIWLMALAFRLLESAGIMRIERQDDFVSLAIAVLVYTVGYMGLRQPEIFRYQTAEHAIPAAAPAPEGGPATEAPRYQRSGLGEREAERLKTRLTELMDREHPWKDSELTLPELAERLATSPHRLSEVLNTELQLTFYDFVNGYRVREVQRRIAEGEAGRLTMLALAMEAGFASKSTFNLVFKKQTGRTPSEYRQVTGA
jgi:AraC-like DNA-binding protein